MGLEKEPTTEVAERESIGQAIVNWPGRFVRGLTFRPGDFGSLTQLFFDNLSTLLGAVFAIINMQNFGVPRDVIDKVVYGKIVPGVGVTLVFGNTYYTWMAIKESKKRGREFTAQPYGLNTPAAFSFVYNIMYPVYFAAQGTEEERFMKAYGVALVANFIAGMIAIVLGCFGPQLLKVVPPAALLVPIAGIGISFLALEQITACLASPIVGYSTIFVMYLGWYSFVRIGWGKFRCPEALQVIITGVILGWATGLNKGQDVKDAAKIVQWYGPTWSAEELFNNFSDISDYLGIVIPIGIAATFTTLMCLVSAKAAGEPYPVRETMIADGVGTMAVALFGSPFGTVVYIGHPAHKRSGARTGYSFMNGWIYFIASWFGILALAASIVNGATIGPIVLFVGLMMCEETLNFIPPRHFSAFILGVFPSIYDWTVNVSGRTPLSNLTQEFNTNLPQLTDGWWGVLAWKRGSLLVSLLWVAVIVYVIDRRWWEAGSWAVFASIFAAFGIIHMPEAGVDNFSTPFWEQCKADPIASTSTTANENFECWKHGEQWMFFVAYLMIGGACFLVELARKFTKSEYLLPPIVDVSYTDAFKDWFHVDEAELHEIETALKGAPKDAIDPLAHRTSMVPVYKPEDEMKETMRMDESHGAIA